MFPESIGVIPIEWVYGFRQRQDLSQCQYFMPSEGDPKLEDRKFLLPSDAEYVCFEYQKVSYFVLVRSIYIEWIGEVAEDGIPFLHKISPHRGDTHEWLESLLEGDVARFFRWYQGDYQL